MNECAKISDLMDYLTEATCAFTAASALKRHFSERGFEELDIEAAWRLVPGQKYFTVVRDSSCIAFALPERIPEEGKPLFRMIGAHTDQPCLKIKPAPEMRAQGYYKLNAEVYGGPIYSTWMDRPLSLAGRVVLRGRDLWSPRVRIVDLKKPVLILPNLAIHMNPEHNKGSQLNPQTDLLPVGALCDVSDTAPYLLQALSEALGEPGEDILDFDLYTYVTEKPEILGFKRDFLSAARLDDLSMVYAAAKALPDQASPAVSVFFALDNEEIGSRTQQGADSDLAFSVLERIAAGLGMPRDTFLRRLHGSYMISADVAHALHPHHPEKADPILQPKLNGGPVIKLSAAQRYISAATDCIVYRNLCEVNQIPVQTFANRSDMRGGSTIGPITAGHIPCRIVDVGIPILAMHSARELMGVSDFDYTARSFAAFYTA